MQKFRNPKSFFCPKLVTIVINHRIHLSGGATSTKEGVVLVSRPSAADIVYRLSLGARFFDRRFRIVDKCTWCYHRITRGLLPACVENCPTGARMFGDIRNPDSTVSKAIKQETIGILKPDLGTENKVYYVGLENGVY
jgi:ferredoxin